MEFCEEWQHCVVRLNFALVDRSWAEKLTHSLMTEAVNAVDAVFQQLEHEAVKRRREGLKRSYSTVCVLCSMSLTHVSGVTATSLH